MKKILACLLALLTLVPLLCACGESELPGTQTTAPSESVTDAQTVDPFDPQIEQMDLKEWDFVIAAPQPGGGNWFDRDEMTDDTINDSIYTRNSRVEDYFNITVSTVEVGWSHDMAAAMQTYLLAGEDVIALMSVPFTQSAKPMITSGIAIPWNDVEHINTDRPWWNKSVTQTMAVLGNYYYLSGDINWRSMPLVTGIYFNKEVAKTLSVPNLYDKVLNKEWTWDTFLSLAKNATIENGDGAWNEQDSYGLLQDYYAIEGWLYGFDYSTMRFDGNGIVPQYYTAKMQDIINRVHSLFHTLHYGYLSESTQELADIFFSNRALFMSTRIGNGEAYRSYETDFGILPNPLYDSKQKEYKTVSDQWGTVMGMPKTTTDTSRTGAVTEMLCAKSMELVRPAFYEKTLMGKIKRDDESEEMLNILYDGIHYDMGWCFLTNLEWLPMRATALAGNTGLSGWWRANEKRINANFTELFDYVKAQKSGA